MILKSEDILKIVNQGESQTVEFKKTMPSDSIIATLMSSFANTDGGILVIGVDDKGEIIGLTDQEALHALRHLKAVTESLLPFPTEVDVVNVNGRNIAYASVQKVPFTHFPVVISTGEVFKRVAQNVQRTSYDELLDIKAPKINKTEGNKKIKAFVAMSFREEEEPALVDYFRAMNRAAQLIGYPLELVRVDLMEGDYEISQKVMSAIDEADIVIADFTLGSKNVYFELGYARGNKKRIIQTARKDTVLEFDIRNWRTIFYRNASELEEKLVSELRQAYLDIVKN